MSRLLKKPKEEAGRRGAKGLSPAAGLFQPTDSLTEYRGALTTVNDGLWLGCRSRTAICDSAYG